MNRKFLGDLQLIFHKSVRYLRRNPQILPGLCFLFLFFYPQIPSDLSEGQGLSVYSAEGNHLRTFFNADKPLPSAYIPDKYPAPLKYLVLLSEDKRYFNHPGLDLNAVLTALFLNIRKMQIRRGASTITQQLARTIFSEYMPANKFTRKLAETYYSFRLELRFNKNEILGAYMNHVTFPGNIAGFANAAKFFFERDVTLLSPAEEAVLTILLRQGKLQSATLAYKAKILLLKAGIDVPNQEIFEVAKMAIQRRRSMQQTDKEHSAEWLQKLTGHADGTFNSTISYNIQKTAYRIIQNEIRILKEYNVDHAAVVVLRLHCSKENLVIAMAGSSDYYDENAGQFNHAVSIRSAGSSLKPLLYALGIEHNHFRGNTIVLDKELFMQTENPEEFYRAQNNDMQYWGKMTMREALLTSRNIPAVAVAERVGVRKFAGFLHDLGFVHIEKNSEKYGPGIALGNSGASPLQLANAYSIFPCGGKQIPLLLGLHSKSGKIFLDNYRNAAYGRKIVSRESAEIITHILTDRKFRYRAYGERSFLDLPFEVAVKTGTSKDYHDSWTVGYSGEYVVAVWVGNSKNKPMRKISGVWGAGRIFQQMMRALVQNNYQKMKYESAVYETNLCRISGKKPGKSCPQYTELLMQKDAEPQVCEGHDGPGISRESESFHLISPMQGEVYFADENSPHKPVEIPIIFENVAGEKNCYWKINSEKERPCVTREKNFVKLYRGNHTLQVTRENEVAQQIQFSVR